MSLNLKRITFKKYLYFLVSVLALGIFLMIFSPVLIHPRFQNFQDYKPLDNWNLDKHAIGDFDNDGKEDMVTFTGCAFLSSVNEDNISADRRCTASGMSNLVFKDSDNKVGQKYVDISETDLGGNFGYGVVSYAYMGENQEREWNIYAERDGKTYVSEIDNGQIKKMTDISLVTKFDRFLYNLSLLFFLGVLIIYVSPLVIFTSVVIYLLKKFVFKR